MVLLGCGLPPSPPLLLLALGVLVGAKELAVTIPEGCLDSALEVVSDHVSNALCLTEISVVEEAWILSVKLVDGSTPGAVLPAYSVLDGRASLVRTLQWRRRRFASSIRSPRTATSDTSVINKKSVRLRSIMGVFGRAS